jgi:hypothetical protein
MDRGKADNHALNSDAARRSIVLRLVLPGFLAGAGGDPIRHIVAAVRYISRTRERRWSYVG